MSNPSTSKGSSELTNSDITERKFLLAEKMRLAKQRKRARENCTCGLADELAEALRKVEDLEGDIRLRDAIDANNNEEYQRVSLDNFQKDQEVFELNEDLKDVRRQLSMVWRENAKLVEELTNVKRELELLRIEERKHKQKTLTLTRSNNMLKVNRNAAERRRKEEVIHQMDAPAVPNVLRWKLEFRFSDRQYLGIRRFLMEHNAMEWQLPSIEKLRSESARLVEEAVLETGLNSENQKMCSFKNIKIIFDRILRKLICSSWEEVPDPIYVVCGGDAGGNRKSAWTKVGFFIASNIKNTQSPKNFVVCAAYDGQESASLIAEAGSRMCEFFGDIRNNGGSYDINGRSVRIEVLVVGDLKFLPMFIGAPHHRCANFCPICMVSRSEHLHAPILDAPGREPSGSGFFVPTSNIVIPPLHVLQGLVNTLIRYLDDNGLSKGKMVDVLKSWSLKPTHQLTSLLNGRHCRKFLCFACEVLSSNMGIAEELYLRPVKNIVLALRNIESYAEARILKEHEIDRLRHQVKILSTEWRLTDLPRTNKLHLLEAHLLPFIETHKSWGLYGEQGLEAVHHIGNVVAERCFGANESLKLELFMKQQILGNYNRFFIIMQLSLQIFNIDSVIEGIRLQTVELTTMKKAKKSQLVSAVETKMLKHSKDDNTWFVRIIHWFFKKCSIGVCNYPWTCIIITTIVTMLLSLKIPLTRMQNDISDFTPYGARSRSELQTYRQFFSNKGEPKAIYAFITSKKGENMLGLNQLNDTVQVLDKISKDFYLNTKSGPKNFESYCSGFCLLNEPVRHFYSGMLISGKHGADFNHLDLGYPVTTVLGTKLFMDPNFFGVEVAVDDQRVVSVSDRNSFTDATTRQQPNNIRKVSLVVLQFRAEIGDDVSILDMRHYERQIVDYFHKDYKSENINVYVLADSFITEEIVRAGLSLLPFLVIGFTIMSIFSSFAFVASGIVQKQMNIYKIVLAVMACVCPFMACGATLGGMFFAGFRFGSILCVTPFLVLAIGVDDAYLMMNAWQRITTHRRATVRGMVSVHDELLHRITEMFIETGPSITITTITNILAFGIGATTPAAEIQLFSVGNALAVCTDFVFTISLYGALMAVVGKYEIEQEIRSPTSSEIELEKSEKCSETSEQKESIWSRIVSSICSMLTNHWICAVVLGLLAVYWYICIVGAMNIKSELSPAKLFLEDSEIVEVFKQRKTHIIPYYSACWILVNNPGDISNSDQREKLEAMIRAFESLPSANGRYSTKFWLRDYEDFLKQSEEIDLPDEENEPAIEFSMNGSQPVTPTNFIGNGNELKQFLEWPEFSFWRGFIQYNESSDGQQYHMSKFLAITAFHGSNLIEWSQRAKLLNEWRAVADEFSDLNVTVYEEDAKFLDLIETMSPVAMQSAFWTFASMFVVAALFISHPPTLFVATFSILSTSVGVFGIMSWWGADLDPIMMSATVMSIGFSVDIPSHVSYHYFQTAKESSDIRKRIRLTVESVGFPIFEASLSTSLCVTSLFFVDLNMAQIFAKCMLLVVLIGLFHGMIVMPVIFSLLDTVPRKLSTVSRHTTESSATISTVVCNIDS